MFLSYHQHASSNISFVSKLGAHRGGKYARRLGDKIKRREEKRKRESAGRKGGLRGELNSSKHPTSSLVWHICCAHGYFRQNASSGECSSGEFFFPARTIVRRGAVKFGDFHERSAKKFNLLAYHVALVGDLSPVPNEFLSGTSDRLATRAACSSGINVTRPCPL